VTSASPVRASSAPPAVVNVFREPTYRRLWASGLCVSVARWMDLVTLGWLALELTGSPFMVGLAAFARSAPMMFLGPLAGIVADRVSRSHVLLVTQAGGAGTAITLAAIFGSGAGGYGPLVALEVVFGILWSLDFPARRTSLMSLLGPARVAQAISLETVSMQVAKMGGPLLAGVCLARFGPASAYALMAVFFAAGLAACLGLHRTIGGPTWQGSASVTRTLRTGLSSAWASPVVRSVLLCTVAMNVLFFPYQHMLPVFARDVLAGGPTVLGALVAADGFGALAGALAIALARGHLAYARVFATAVMVAPVILVGFSLSRELAVCLVLLAAIGVAESGFAAMQSTLVLLSAPSSARGGTMGILSACIGTQPVGTLAIGLLAAAVGAPVAFAINAVVALVVIVPLAVPLARRGRLG
jgi:MFS family permease